jgi:hypothetical protein
LKDELKLNVLRRSLTGVSDCDLNVNRLAIGVDLGWIRQDSLNMELSSPDWNVYRDRRVDLLQLSS